MAPADKAANEHGSDDKHRGILRQCHYEVTGTAQTGQYGGGMRGVPASVFDEETIKAGQ